MNPYGSFAYTTYSDTDVAREMQNPANGGTMPSSYAANSFATVWPEQGYPISSELRTLLPEGGAYPESLPKPTGGWVPDAGEIHTIAAANNQDGQPTRPTQLWDYEMEKWLQTLPGERIVDQWYEAPNYLGQRELGRQYAYVKKPYITMEKVVEVPQTVVKEMSKEVPKPEIIERIIEVPKMEYMESRRVGPTKHETKEQVVEVQQTAWEEHVRHVPRLEVQERLIEIPRVEFREVVEYEDRHEYREVLVDKIVEVPEIEYRIRKVEHFVPQTYVQEEYVERYQEVPINQVQEVERQEYAPVQALPAAENAAMPPASYTAASVAAMKGLASASPHPSALHTVPMQSQCPVTQAYATYDPYKAGSGRSQAGMPPQATMLPPGMSMPAQGTMLPQQRFPSYPAGGMPSMPSGAYQTVLPSVLPPVH